MRNNFTQNTFNRKHFHNQSALSLAQGLEMNNIPFLKNNLVGIKRPGSPLLGIFGRLSLLVIISLLSLNVSAQITEHFTSETHAGQTFSEGGFSFGITGSYLRIENYTGFGWTGSAVDNDYIDNFDLGAMPSAGVIGSIINSSKDFYVHSMYLAPGDASFIIGQYGNVIIRGKLNGTTQFTHTLLSTEINNNNPVVKDNSFTKVDLSGYNTIAVDEIEFELTGNLRYLAIDAFVFGDASNSAPTNISLSASSVNENVASNTTIGTLSSTDPDAGNTFTYTLVAGTGSTDNASFNISGNSLRITNSPDFETKSSYSVRVRTTDQGSLMYEKAFTITINDAAEAPADISLSASSLNENVAANTTVGTLSSTDQDAGNTFTYTLVAGTGSTDNASFNISGSSLRITNSPDYETKNSYSVRVRTTDQGNLTYEEAFTITISNVNETPTDITLSASSINENVAANSTVGTLSSTDPDAASSFTYTLVAGTGDTDNASFNISGGNLRITNSPDFETKSSYSVRIRTSDGALTYEEAFSITISNVNETPTDITLSASSINENVTANSTVGTLTSTDPDAGSTFTYTLVAGTGSTDNASFNISGSSLRITNSPDYETKSSYSVRVRTSDGALTYEEAFTITISNVNETPTDITLSASSINENVTANSTVGTLTSTDPDAGSTFTYTLVAGTGSTDNASFNISGSSLRITNSPDYETKSSYSVRVRTSDGALTYEEAFTITISNVNETPTDITLSASSINENVTANSTVGTLTSTDPDAGSTFTYTLVAGTGSTDNASFNISGSSLRITNSPDYETKSSYSVRVRTSDGALTYEEAFTITISNVNETPTDITLSASSINENAAANSTVGTLGSTDPDAGNTFTYTLVAGTGSTDNASFNISGSSLRITNSPDYETKSSYSVRVRTSDGALTYEEAFTITISNVNETPTDITLSASSINENIAANSTVGTLGSTDQDAANTFTYTLVAGTGSTDNASFNISGSSLRITNSPDFETKSSYSVRVRTTDQGSLTYEESFTITIYDVNETPTDVSLSSTSIADNVPVNTTVGNLSSTDPDAGSSFTYSLVAGTGDTDNASFNISGNSLRISIIPDYETKSSYSIRIRTTDQGSLTYEKAFTITVLSTNVAPTDIALSATSINENVTANSTVGSLSSTDPDAGNSFTYTLVAGTGDTDNASFNISGSSLRISNSPNFETRNSYSVRIRTTDQGSLTYEKAFTITINNVNETPTNITLSASSVDENLAANTTVGTLGSTDPDAGNTFTYSLVSGSGDTDNASFNISGDDLKISYSPNYETKNSYSVRIRTTDQGSLNYEKAFTITINNVNEVPAIMAGQLFMVDENATAGTAIDYVLAMDGDNGTTFSNWTITACKDKDGNTTTNVFAINANTGQISVTGNLDREANQALVITVTVSDGVNTSLGMDVSINLRDMNDVIPVITASQVFHIAEQSANGTSVGTIAANDGDVTATTYQNWTITAGNENGHFAINSSTGAITVADNTGLTPQSFSLTITVSDGVNTSAPQTVSVIVDGVNDDTPVITASQAFAIDENAANSATVGQVLATDPDYGTVFQGWAITAGNTDNAFAISGTGNITVNNSSVLDYETTTTFQLTVQVSDGIHTGSGSVTVNLNNINDNAPVASNATFAIDENSANGAALGTVTATDADGNLNNLTYSITAGNTNNAFAINSANGEITVNNSSVLNFEVTPVFNLTIGVTDGSNSSNATITVNLKDVVETGIEELAVVNINVHPNPATSKITVSTNTQTSQYTIEIVNMAGIKVCQSIVLQNESEKTIDLTGIPSGLYIVKMYNKQFNITRELIVLSY